jgi:hypothetical protein
MARDEEPVNAEPASSRLEQELGGDLPCVVCGYNLRGISIRSVCPECGTAVRATILAVVDPLASELRPIPHPRLVAAGLVLWAGAGLAAAVLCWLPHVAAAWALVRGGQGGAAVEELSRDLALPAAALVLVSGLGALTLVRPHAGLSRSGIYGAAAAAVAYVPLAWLVWKLGTTPFPGSGYLQGWAPDVTRLRLRLAMGSLLVLIMLGLRPNARVLVSRSLAMRSGRVDRQTMLAMAVAAAVAMAGDALALGVSALGGGTAADTARVAAVVLIATGSAFLTLGLAGGLMDCWRIARAVVRPAPTAAEVLGGRGAAATGEGSSA